MNIMSTENKTSRLFIELPADKHKQLRIIAATEGKSMKDIILECIAAKSSDVERLAQTRPAKAGSGGAEK